jgi:hypothetical protein
VAQIARAAPSSDRCVCCRSRRAGQWCVITGLTKPNSVYPRPPPQRRSCSISVSRWRRRRDCRVCSSTAVTYATNAAATAGGQSVEGTREQRCDCAPLTCPCLHHHHVVPVARPFAPSLCPIQVAAQSPSTLLCVGSTLVLVLCLGLAAPSAHHPRPHSHLITTFSFPPRAFSPCGNCFFCPASTDPQPTPAATIAHNASPM